MRFEIDLTRPGIVVDPVEERPTIRVIVEGPSNVVQRLADAIETVLPGFMEWGDHALSGSNDARIIVVGTGMTSLFD